MTNKLPTTRWVFDLSTWSPTLNELAQAVAVIQPEERIRLMKFYFISDFLSSLVGRLLMRKYVSQSCGLHYADIKFARDSKGKPFWVRNEVTYKATTPSGLSFNVSHQGDYVILAGAVSNNNFKDFGVGCDVMKVEYSGGKDLKEFFRLMHKQFADSEWQYIRQPHFNQKQQLGAFIRHWCLKESYVKELGVGITVDLQKIAFNIDTSIDLTVESQPICGTSIKFNGLPLSEWRFEEHMIDAKYCAAIAFRNFEPQIVDKFQLLSITDLLETSAAQDNREIREYCREVLNKPSK